jgi:hypothetical protein
MHHFIADHSLPVYSLYSIPTNASIKTSLFLGADETV